MRFVAIGLGILCALATAAGVVVVRAGSVSALLHPASTAAPSKATASGPGASSAGGKNGLEQVGVVTNSLANFQKATSAYPSITVHYIWWGTPFPTSTILTDRRLGATNLLVLEPQGVSLTGIADGREDAYLKKFAAAERSLGLPILLSFGPEANGNWYSWGAHHITPALYVAMWRQVHDVIEADGGTKITWLWQMNTPWPQSEPMSLLWPGKAYVNEVGLDSQMESPGETFSYVFGPSLSQVRAITSDPILISEVSVRVEAGIAPEITSLFKGACQDHLMGVILFDVYSEWEFDHDTQAVAAFRKAATSPCPI
jgi:hypothetical protein